MRSRRWARLQCAVERSAIEGNDERLESEHNFTRFICTQRVTKGPGSLRLVFAGCNLRFDRRTATLIHRELNRGRKLPLKLGKVMPRSDERYRDQSRHSTGRGLARAKGRTVREERCDIGELRRVVRAEKPLAALAQSGLVSGRGESARPAITSAVHGAVRPRARVCRIKATAPV